VLCVNRLSDAVHVAFGEGAMLKRKEMFEKLYVISEGKYRVAHEMSYNFIVPLKL